MDLTAELDELSHGLHRERRLIELTTNRLQLAALVLERRSELPPGVSLGDVQRVLEHLHHEELFRAILVSGIADALGTRDEPDLLEIIANAPRNAGACLDHRRSRLVRAIDAADALAERLRLNALEPAAAHYSSRRSDSRADSRGVVIELEPTVAAGTLAETARRVVQPSMRHFICRAG
jgi:hypothetical protein